MGATYPAALLLGPVVADEGAVAVPPLDVVGPGVEVRALRAPPVTQCDEGVSGRVGAVGQDDGPGGPEDVLRRARRARPLGRQAAPDVVAETSSGEWLADPVARQRSERPALAQHEVAPEPPSAGGALGRSG